MEEVVPLLQGFAAFGVVFAVVALQWITGEYPRTYPFLRRCWEFYAYCGIYGLVSLFAYEGVGHFLSPGQLTTSGMSNRWIQAVALGLATKALLNIRLFTVYSNGKPVPIGIETITLLFEPWLDGGIRMCHYQAEARFLEAIVRRHSNLRKTKTTIKSNIPSFLRDADKAALVSDIEGAASVRECLSEYLARVGRADFLRVFP